MFSEISGIAWATPLLMLSGYGLIRYFIKPDKDDPDHINWSPWETIGITVAIYFVSQFVGGLLAYILPLALNSWNIEQASSWLEKNTYGQFLLVLAIEAIAVLMLSVFVKRRNSSFKSLGLVKPKWLDLAYVLLGFVIYLAALVLMMAIIKEIFHIDTDQKQEIGFERVTQSQLPLVFIALVVLPPLVEELLVRGFLYSGLRKHWNKLWAILLTSILFALAHLQFGNDAPLLWAAAADTFILSLVLIFLKEKTGSLIPCIGLHMLKNGIAYFGLFVYPLIK